MKEQINVSKDIIDNIDKKRILFFAPAFFGYENKIVKKMEDMGAEVDMYDVRSVTKAHERALLKVSTKLFKRKSLKYYANIMASKRNQEYDYILIVKCDMTPEFTLEKLKKEHPNAKMCLYLWDSVENIPGVINKFKYFDTLHSFDLNDCKKYPILKFRPLFFVEEFSKKQAIEKYKYDICFIGTIHSDRFEVIKQMQEIINKNNYTGFWFWYLQSKFIYYIYKLTINEFRNTKITDFSFKKMQSTEIASIVNDTKIILDIQHPKQTGLTMRTIEMLGMNKKIVTTNESIKQYDFYNPQNISVVDRKSIKLDKEFLRTSYEPLDEEVYNKYSLHSWILEVLS